jgi:5-formyltetrahydrofolate cyclo-ligase
VELAENVEFAEGDFHIPEPKNHPYTGDFDLIVVPGMAFDKAGHRLGRGKGYYDRFLSQYPQVYTIGLCFDFQLLPEVPSEPHDCLINEVISL